MPARLSPRAADRGASHDSLLSTAADTPTSSFHAMNVVVVDGHERGESIASPPHKRDQQFGCEFDPSLKSARLLVSGASAGPEWLSLVGYVSIFV